MFIVTARTAKQPCVCHASAASIPCAVRNATSDLTHALYCKSSRSLHASLKKADHGSPLTERISCPPELRGNFYDRNTHIGNLPERQPAKRQKSDCSSPEGHLPGKIRPLRSFSLLIDPGIARCKIKRIQPKENGHHKEVMSVFFFV